MCNTIQAFNNVWEEWFFSSEDFADFSSAFNGTKPVIPGPPSPVQQIDNPSLFQSKYKMK